ncbi:MAG: hypothetical protein ACK5JT_12505 [Hyphomicrobiaceae bacterium]
MTGRERTSFSLAELEDLLDAFGGASERWPDARRAAALELIARDSSARRLLEEAQALDRLLDKASAPDPARVDDLLGRLMASPEVVVGGRVVTSEVALGSSRALGDNVVAMPMRHQAPVRPHHSTGRRADKWGRRWQIAAALIGALLMGVAVGNTDYMSTATAGLVDEVAQDRGETDMVLESLQFDPIIGVFDEETR